MINAAGSFAAIWLLCWVLLGLLFAAVYPSLRNQLLRLHPRICSGFLLAALSSPFLLSLLVTVFLFLPDSNSVLVDTHCHDDCSTHPPLLESGVLAWFGTLCLAGVLAGLTTRLVTTLRQSHSLHRQFAVLAVRREGYRLILTAEPVVFTLGWWKPEVYISEGLLERCSGQDLAVILSHEHAHRRRRDNMRGLAARILTAGMPTVTATAMRADLAGSIELTCDFEAAEQHGFLEVAEVLLRVKRIVLRHGGSVPMPVGISAFAASEVETRIRALLDADKYTDLPRWQIGAVMGLGFSVTVLLVEPIHHAAEWLFRLTGHV
jgi:Zn-dependent protease with chaperone function